LVIVNNFSFCKKKLLFNLDNNVQYA